SARQWHQRPRPSPVPNRPSVSESSRENGRSSSARLTRSSAYRGLRPSDLRARAAPSGLRLVATNRPSSVTTMARQPLGWWTGGGAMARLPPPAGAPRPPGSVEHTGRNAPPVRRSKGIAAPAADLVRLVIERPAAAVAERPGAHVLAIPGSGGQ